MEAHLLAYLQNSDRKNRFFAVILKSINSIYRLEYRGNFFKISTYFGGRKC